MISDNSLVQIHEYDNATIMYDPSGTIQIIRDNKIFYTDADEGLYKILQGAPCWYISKGYLETFISNTHIPFSSVVWTYFHGILSAKGNPCEAMLHAQKYLTSRGLVIDHLTETKENNHLYALAAMPEKINLSLSNLRTRIRYPCYFHMAYNYEAKCYMVKCGIDRKGYVKRFIFKDLTAEDESIKLKKCLHEFCAVARKKGLIMEKPGNQNLLYCIMNPGNENEQNGIPNYKRRSIDKIPTEPLSRYVQFEEGSFEDMGKLLKKNLKMV